MPSHAYFFDSNAVPDWGAEPQPETKARAQRRRGLADAVCSALPRAHENPPFSDDDHCIRLTTDALEINVFDNFLHLRIGWRSVEEHDALGLVDGLHAIANAVAPLGFDFFEHGCQGLGVRGDIDEVPYVIAGTTRQLRAAFGVSPGSLDRSGSSIAAAVDDSR